MLKQSRKVLLSSVLAFIMLFSNTSFVFAEETTEVEKTEIVEEAKELEVEKVDEVKEFEKNETETKNLEPMSIMPFAASSGGTRIVEMKKYDFYTKGSNGWGQWAFLGEERGSFAIISIPYGGTYLADMVNNSCMRIYSPNGVNGSIDNPINIYEQNDAFGIEIEYEAPHFLIRTQTVNGNYDYRVRVGITIFE